MRVVRRLNFFSMAFSPKESTVLSIVVTTSSTSLRKSAVCCAEFCGGITTVLE